MNSQNTSILEGINTVLVYKDRCMLEAFNYVAHSRNKTVDVYIDPQQFLAVAWQYPKNTKIILGRTFDKVEQTGIQIAYHLHELGFKRLYLITFDPLMKNEIPEYLIHIHISTVDADQLIGVLDY